MRRILLGLLGSILFIVSIGLVSCGGGSNDSPPAEHHYIYASDSEGAKIATFKIDDTTGVLEVSSSEPTNPEPRCIALHPSGDYLFVATEETNTDNNSIQIFQINRFTGELSLVDSHPIENDPNKIVFTPDGFLMVLYMMDKKLESYTVSLKDYSYNLNGSIEFVNRPTNMAVHPSGDYLYVAVNAADANIVADPGSLCTYSVAIGGELSEYDEMTAGIQPTQLVLNSTGTYLYLANYTSSTLEVFSIGETGQAVSVNDYSVSGPGGLTVSANNSYLVVAGSNGMGVQVFSVSGDDLAEVQGSPFDDETHQGSSAAFDPSGQFLFIARSYDEGWISAYSFNDQTGELTFIGEFGSGNFNSMAVN